MWKAYMCFQTRRVRTRDFTVSPPWIREIQFWEHHEESQTLSKCTSVQSLETHLAKLKDR